MINLFKWIGVFSLFYILLLPLGGYRDYRPNVLRHDTILPITLSLIFVFGQTTLYIIYKLSKQQRYRYLPLIALVLFIFTFSDQLPIKNSCDRKALELIANSNNEEVKIQNNCKLLSWKIIDSPKDSELSSELLKRWNIIKQDKLYYNIKSTSLEKSTQTME